MRKVAYILAVTAMVCLWTSGASAETDRVARIRVKKLETTVNDLQTKVVALQLLVNRLEQRNEEQEKEIDANYALIQMLAKQVGAPK